MASVGEEKEVGEKQRVGGKKGGRLIKWASQMKGDMAEERRGRLQRALMSQPFRQTTLLQPATACTPETAHTRARQSERVAPMAEGQGTAKVACSCITLCEWMLVLTLQPPHANLAQTQTL